MFFFFAQKSRVWKKAWHYKLPQRFAKRIFLFRASPNKPFTHLDRKTPLKSCLFQKLHKARYPWRYEEGELSIHDLCACMPQKPLPQEVQLLIDSCLLSLSICWFRASLPFCLSNMLGSLLWALWRPPRPSHLDRQPKEKLYSLGT